MTNPVVVGVDSTGRSLKALMWAAHRAALHGVPLRVVHALPRYEGDIPLFPPGRFEEAESVGREMIADAASLVREAYPDLDMVTQLPMGSPTHVLLTESENAHVVVVGAKGEDIGNMLLGSTALQLVGHAACPVIVVNHIGGGYHQVAVGTDLSPNSTDALAFAFNAASFGNSRLRVISALGLPQGWPRHLLRPLPADDAEVETSRTQVETQIEPFRAEYPEVDVELDVHRVDPLQSLVSASHRADMLVVGSRGRGGFHGLAVGSTTHKLLHVVGCPMAVVNSHK